MKVFVIMPFDKDYNDIFKIGIKETAKELKVNAYRLDEELFEEGMLDKIYSEIESADFIIADLSNKNPNVFYELGYAHAIGKLCILITKYADNIPFDLKHKRHIVYGDSLINLKEQLSQNIVWAKDEITKRKNNPFELELNINGILETTKRHAKASLNFILDIENKSKRVSPEIQAIYIHTASKWDIKQKGNIIPFRKSERKSYNYKYLFTAEISKIPKNGWTQLEFDSMKTLASAWKKEKIKYNYTIQGNLFIEIATDKGDFSKEIPISINIDTLPF